MPTGSHEPGETGGRAAQSAAAPKQALRKTIAARLWWLLAYASLGLGLVGIAVPGLPTVPFVLLAAFAAARGSRRLRAWLLAHRRFGPVIRDWEREGAVSRRAKLLAIGMMVPCAGIMFLTAPKGWMAATGSAIMACVAYWLWRRPEPR